MSTDSRKKFSEISGVIAAVKCAICDTLHPAESDTFVAFYGSATVGLDDVLVGVEPPRKPAKRAISCVCRDPRCVADLVKRMLGCTDDRGDADRLWAQALSVWATAAGHTLVEKKETRANPPKKRRPRARPDA